jgi:hypothetical protein
MLRNNHGIGHVLSPEIIKSANHSQKAWCWAHMDCYINVQESLELKVDSKRKREGGAEGLETEDDEGYKSKKLEDELGKLTARK